jgi:replicative DNA helicase
MTCITVDAPDSLFATRGCILTHNSWTMMRMATAAIMEGYNVQYNALEQTRAEVAMRIHTFLSTAVGRELFRNLDLMQGRNFNLESYREFLHSMKDEISGKMHVSDTSRGKVSPLTIASQIERNKPDIVFIDYLTLMEKSGDGDWKSIAKLSGEMKNLAMQYQVPIVCAAQLNRAMGLGKEPAGPEALAQSDSIGQDSDAVITIRQSSASVLQMKLAKYRHGLGGFKWHCQFQPGKGIFKEVTHTEAQLLKDADDEADDND